VNLTNRNGVWVLEYREKGKRVRISTGERDRARADEVALALLAGKHEKSRTWTLKEALNDCYDRIWSKQKSAEGARYLIDKLCSRGLDVLVGQMNYAYLVELRKRMTAPAPEGWGVTESRANRYMSAISKALSEAVDLGKLEHRPKIPYGVEPKGKLRWLTADEEARLLAACGELWNETEAGKMRALLVFLLDTGARLSEALKAGSVLNRRAWANPMRAPTTQSRSPTRRTAARAPCRSRRARLRRSPASRTGRPSSPWTASPGSATTAACRT
jgi:hypothetical protein